MALNRENVGIVTRREHVTKKARAENDMTKTLVVVVLMFVSCQLLNPVRRILQAVLPAADRRCGSAFFYYYGLTAPALALDSASHFFVYSVCNRRFVEKLRDKWRRLAARSAVTPATAGRESALPAVDGSRTASRVKTAPLAIVVSASVQPGSSAVANTASL